MRLASVEKYYCNRYIHLFSSTVAPIDTVYGTLGLVNAITTQQYSGMSKLRKEIEGAGSYTFFAPSDEAWDLLDAVLSVYSSLSKPPGSDIIRIV